MFNFKQTPNKITLFSYINRDLTNAMEGLYLRSNIHTLIKYYNIANNKTKKDINKLLLKSNNGIQLTQKELHRIKKYIFRYKMIIQSVSINTDSRLNKLTRKSLTTPSKDFI